MLGYTPAASDNWVSSGTTNSTLPGTARMNGLVVTNGSTLAAIVCGSISSSSDIMSAANSVFFWSGRSQIASSANGLVKVQDSGGADAVLLYRDSMAVGSALTLSVTNRFYLVNVDAQTVTLPTAASVAGKTYCIKTISPAATATIATTSSQLIDGASTYSLTASNKYVRCTSDGTNWWIFGSN